MRINCRITRVCSKKHNRNAHNSQAQRVFKTAPLFAQTNPDPTAPQSVIDSFTQFFESLWNPTNVSIASQKSGLTFAYDEDGTLIADTLTGGASTTWAQTAKYIHLPTASGPMPIAAIYGTKHYAIQSDHLNTPRRLIQSDGQVAWQWSYSAFGDEKPTIAKNRFANADLSQSFGATTVPAVTFNLRYPGQYFDAESNLHYNYHRSYNATLGRYTQADPIGLDGGWNRFGYVGGNALSRVDPTGLVTWTGTYHARSLIEAVGAGWVDMVLTSECINGKKFIANVTGVGPGVGVGVPKIPLIGSDTYGKFSVKDNLSSVDPNILSGGFAWISVGISIGTRDISFGRVRVGRAFGNNPDHSSGLDIGVSGILGTSTVTSGRWESCECE